MLAKGKNLTDSDTVIGTSRYKYYNKRYNCMSNITSRTIDSTTRITSSTSAANIVFSVPELDAEEALAERITIHNITSAAARTTTAAVSAVSAVTTNNNNTTTSTSCSVVAVTVSAASATTNTTSASSTVAAMMVVVSKSIINNIINNNNNNNTGDVKYACT